MAAKLAEKLAEINGGIVYDAKDQTVGEFLNLWLEDSVKRNVRHRTYANYRLQVDKHIVPALGQIKLKNLTSAQVQRFYNIKLDAGLAPSTVRYIHAVLHRALKQAVKWRLVSENVAGAVDLPKLESE